MRHSLASLPPRPEIKVLLSCDALFNSSPAATGRSCFSFEVVSHSICGRTPTSDDAERRGDPGGVSASLCKRS
jgi:hypothetical protein